MGLGYLFLFFSSICIAQNANTSQSVVVPGYESMNPQPVLRYESLQERPDQVRLVGVHLEYKGQIFYPAVHIAAYMDETSGTSICKTFGYGSGVLGPASVNSGNFFSMDRMRRLSDLRFSKEDSDAGSGTDEVICDRL